MCVHLRVHLRVHLCESDKLDGYQYNPLPVCCCRFC